MDVVDEVIHAEERIRPFVRFTYLEPSPFLSELRGAKVRCKLENLQHTGSFKVRGAMNRLLSLTSEDLARGVVAASTGNHGKALAWCLKKLDARGTIFVPETASHSKVQAIERMGAVVHSHGTDAIETERHARRYARERGLHYISPYNDPKVIGGQGTVGFELLKQLEETDAVFVSLGGGGLIAGLAGYLKAKRPGIRIFGCSPENSRVMIQSVRAGKILDLPSLPTLSDATAGGIEAGSITFDLCRKLVDDYVTVTEEEIREALLLFLEHHGMIIEGSAAVAVAAYMKHGKRVSAENVVIVICGSNIDLGTLRSLL